MRYIGESGVEIGAWAAIGADSEIRYLVLPGSDTIEFTIGGRHGLDLDMSGAGLRNCIAAFTKAFGEFSSVDADQPNDTDDVAREDQQEERDAAQLSPMSNERGSE